MEDEEELTFTKKRKRLKKGEDLPIMQSYNLIIILLSIVIFLVFGSLYVYHISNNNNNENITVKSNKNLKASKKILNKTKDNQYKKNQTFSILLPGKNCPNKNLITIYLKRKNDGGNKRDEKNLRISSMNYYEQSFFTETDSKKEFREVKLKKLGLKLYDNISIHNLYLIPYSSSKKLKKAIANSIINKYQKINRYFNFIEYVSKSLLYDNYYNMKEIFPSEYNYMLETYSYPEDKDVINTKFANYSYETSSKDNLWLVKPKLGSLGSSISILKNISVIKKGYLITKFLNNPHLINGYKYDLRIHGLVTSIKPLKIYLYNEGLVRVATEKYDYNNQSNVYSILTNLYLNKRNKKKFIYPKNMANIEESNLWNLEAFEKYCLRNGLNYNKMMEDIGDIFIKLIFSVRKKIINEINNYKLKSSNFYHLIGFDILFDENLKPYLLEANRLCGLRGDNDAEKYYTHNIIVDTINLVGIRIINKENNTIYSDTKYTNKLKEIIDDNLCELDRPRGGYSLIYPLKKNINKYKKYYCKRFEKTKIFY
jgi:hypothetical protein